MSFLLNPFVFAGAAGDFESIATVTVGSGGASSIEFTSIPGTYQHLQVRYIARSSRSVGGDRMAIRLNSDVGSNYVFHILKGDGSSAVAGSGTARAEISLDESIADEATASNMFGVGVIDILDYSNVSKNTTARVFHGRDFNGFGTIGISSGLWIDTNGVTAITLFPSVGPNFVEHSTAALYGIKA